MTLRVSGKNVDIGESLRSHVEGRVSDALGKYFTGGFSGHVTVEKEGSGFRTECSLHLGTGITLQAIGNANEAYKSFDQAAERIEKQLRRYKRKLKDHHNDKARSETIDGAYYVLEAPKDEDEVPADFSPVIIAESTKALKTLTVGGAVMELDLTDAPFVMFRNAANAGLNVVYRRRDGNIGWIDPTLANASS